MGILDALKKKFAVARNRSADDKPVVVTFTGGMGAQIISAAIYFSLKHEGRNVFADLSYFTRGEHVAVAGNPGDCSHWAWQLDAFGLDRGAFEVATGYSRRDVRLIEDGPEKIALGLNALGQPLVQEYFAVPAGNTDVLPLGWADYLCVHVRRGDYVNVASHLVPDSEFIALSAKFSKVVKSIVVVSDSPVEGPFRQAVSAAFQNALFLDNIDAVTSHRVMRGASILICSNSQFSLIAALLNPQALAILPKQWFGGKDRAIEAPISEACRFQILA